MSSRDMEVWEQEFMSSRDMEIWEQEFMSSQDVEVWEQEFMSSRDMEIREQEFVSSLNVPIFSQDICVMRKDRNIEARHKLLFPSEWETTFLSYLTTLQHQQTNETAITGCVSTTEQCSTLLSSHIPEGDVMLNV